MRPEDDADSFVVVQEESREEEQLLLPPRYSLRRGNNFVSMLPLARVQKLSMRKVFEMLTSLP